MYSKSNCRADLFCSVSEHSFPEVNIDTELSQLPPLALSLYLPQGISGQIFVKVCMCSFRDFCKLMLTDNLVGSAVLIPIGFVLLHASKFWLQQHAVKNCAQVIMHLLSLSKTCHSFSCWSVKPVLIYWTKHTLEKSGKAQSLWVSAVWFVNSSHFESLIVLQRWEHCRTIRRR